jgi:hypothetical protein
LRTENTEEEEEEEEEWRVQVLTLLLATRRAYRSACVGHVSQSEYHRGFLKWALLEISCRGIRMDFLSMPLIILGVCHFALLGCERVGAWAAFLKMTLTLTLRLGWSDEKQNLRYLMMLMMMMMMMTELSLYAVGM